MRNIKFLILAVLGIIVYAISPTSLNEWEIFDGQELNKIQLYSYDDEKEEGNSKILEAQINNDMINWKYIIGSKLKNPYCGIGFYKNNKPIPEKRDLIDLSGYDSLIVEIKGKQTQKLNLNILTADSKHTQIDNSSTFKLNTKEFQIGNEWKRISIALDDLYIPDWWFKNNNIQPDWNQKYLHKTWKIEFSPDYNLTKDQVDEVQIRYIKLSGYSNTGFGILMGYLFIIFVLSIGLNSGTKKRIKKNK